MIIINYSLSVLLYILLLPISTPAAFIVSTWARPDMMDDPVGQRWVVKAELIQWLRVK